MFIDSHCHLQPFDPEKLRLTLSRARQAEVAMFISMSQSLKTSSQTVDLHQREDSIWVGVGVHPWQAVPIDAESQDRLLSLTEREGVVAVGEIGLDFERVTDREAHDVQVQALSAQLRIARDMGLPVSLHCKGAHAQMFDILAKEGTGVAGVIHSFVGTAEELNAWLGRGFYVGVGYRALTRPGKEAALALARQVPLDRLVLESDASSRSAWEDSQEKVAPSDVRSVAEILARDRGITVEELGQATTTNVRRLFRLPSED